MTPETTEPAALIPAATVLLLRDFEGSLQTLMLRRNRSLKAFGGAWVFPGGRVDPADAPDSDDDMVRARAAACREAEEETGLTIAPDDLVSLSLWIPPVQEKRRFSTQFFLAPAPDMPVKIDDGEIHDYKWMCPKEIVANMPNPDMMIMPPTYVSLFELSQFNTKDEALNGINAVDDEKFETRFHRTDTGFVTLWSPDCAYETGDLNIDGPRRRLITNAERWDYQKDF